MVFSVCFPATAQVQLASGISRPVSSLKPFDVLQTLDKARGFSRTKPSTFYTYLHFDENLTTEYLVLKCENDTQLVISEAHILFKRNCLTESARPMMARNVEIGDYLLYVNAEKEIQNVRVTGIDRKMCQGAFAPLTKSGTFIVDGFLVSSYAHVHSHAKAHASMAPLRLWYKLNSKIGKPLSIRNSGAENGIHSYAKTLACIYGLS